MRDRLRTTADRDAASFEKLLGAERLAATEMRALADALVARHATARRAPDLAPDAAAHARAIACQADLLSTSPQAGAEAVLAALARARQFLDASADRLLARAGSGRILASALPLQLADVQLAANGRIEISDHAENEVPGADDAVLELAHLVVSLRLHGRADLAERLVSHYAGACEDFELYRVLDFYADVCLIERHAAGAVSGNLEPTLQTHANQSASPGPVVLATSGPVASGKSSLARALADQLGLARIVSDRIRDHLVHGAPGRALHEAGWAKGFEPGIAPRIYAELLARGELVLATGRSIVLDAAFPTPRERDAVRSLARRHGVPFRFVSCRVDPAEQERRLRERDQHDGETGAWETIARRFDEQFVPPDELATDERIQVDTTGPLDDALASALDALGRSHVFEAPGAAAGRASATGVVRRPALPRRIRAVTFDCWRTLLVETDWAGAHARRVDALVEAVRGAGLDVGWGRARDAFDAAWHRHTVAWTSGLATGAPEIARDALQELGAEVAPALLSGLITRWQQASHTGRVRAVEGARATLGALADAGIGRALVCDTGLTPGHVVKRLLAGQRLLPHLETCAFSDEVGLPKPDPAPFRAALAELGVAPEEAAHVGDLRRTDVAGAHALGMATIRLRAVYDDPSPLPEADAVADSLADVLRLVGIGS